MLSPLVDPFSFFALPRDWEVDRKPAREEKLITPTFRPYSSPFRERALRRPLKRFADTISSLRGNLRSPILRQVLTKRSFLKASNHEEARREKNRKRSRNFYLPRQAVLSIEWSYRAVDTVRPPATVPYSKMNVTYDFVGNLTDLSGSDKSSLINARL